MNCPICGEHLEIFDESQPDNDWGCDICGQAWTRTELEEILRSISNAKIVGTIPLDTP